MGYEEILKQLESLSNPKAVAGMARFGINPGNTYGVSIPNLRKIAREAGKNHVLIHGMCATSAAVTFSIKLSLHTRKRLN